VHTHTQLAAVNVFNQLFKKNEPHSLLQFSFYINTTVRQQCNSECYFKATAFDFLDLLNLCKSFSTTAQCII